MHFLITGIFGLNLSIIGISFRIGPRKCSIYCSYLGASWFSTSVISCWCFSCFLVFMILTMAAWKEKMVNELVYAAVHLDEQFPILLYVLVGQLHLLPLLGLHRNVDIHLEREET